MLLTEAHLELEPPKVVSAIQTETLSTNIISAKAVTSVHFHVYFRPLNQTSLVHQAPNRIALRLYIKLQLESLHQTSLVHQALETSDSHSFRP